MTRDFDRTAHEKLTREIGERMFAAMRSARPSLLQARWWEERAMRWLMNDEWLKVQAFRFVDVLPMMNDRRDVAHHLRQYFVHPAVRAARRARLTASGAPLLAPLADAAPAPSRMSRLISAVMDFPGVDSPRARLLSGIASNVSVAMAHRFIAGTRPAEAAAAVRRMRDRSAAFTIDVLGEAAVSEVESEDYQKIYFDLLDELPGLARQWPEVPLIDRANGVALPRVNVSVKLTSLYSQFDPIDPEGTKRNVKDRLRPILRRGMAGGCHVHIDMEHYFIKDLTLAICREVFMEDEFRDYPHFGVVLQAYLKDAERDAAELIAWCKQRGTPIWVRLVKGAYWDTETVVHDQLHWPWPVWEQKWMSDACYERMTHMLLAAHAHIHTALGSHNIRSLAHGLALKRMWDVPPTAFELQMLFGMGDPIREAGAEMGERCRVYTPYGDLLPGMAYLIRRLLENTANESFLRHSVDPDTPVGELLRDPQSVGDDTAPFKRTPLKRYERGEEIMQPFVNIAETDFSREPNRQKMLKAIDAVRATFGRQCPLVIDGERVVTDAWDDSRCPSRPSIVVGRAARGTRAAADRAAKVAASRFESWRRTPVAERADVLFDAAKLMERDRFELAAIESFECAKPWREADADIAEAIDFLNYYATEMLRLARGARRRDVPGETNEYFYRPRGVVAVIAPWNFPLAILTGMTSAALVAGNTVVMKPAEQAPVIAYRLMELFEEAGLPKGVLSYVPGPGEEVGDALVRHEKVAMTVFTGSRAVGTHINQVSADTLTDQPGIKKVIAEMGGKNATIVDSDADLDEAVKGVLHAAFGYAGQKCSASSRCIVLDGVYDRFTKRLVEAARSLQVGPGDDCGTFVPPVIDAESYDRCRRYIEIGKGEAKLALEVDTSALVAETGGYYVGPTIFLDTPPEARIAQEEIFGPVLAVIRARDIAHAIEIFNGTDYALTGGIFSRSPAHIERAREECEYGNFYINRKITGALVDLQPFGGFKMSGMGSKAGGPDYLLQFCEPRTVTENTMRRGFAPSEKVAESLRA